MATSSLKQNMLAAGKLLGVFAVIASALVAITFQVTKSQIASNEREALLKSLHVLVPPEMHDNDMYTDNIELNIPGLDYRNKPVTIYRARKKGKSVAAIFNVTAPDGYSGPIKMLVAVDEDLTLLGVRVISHKETPGLGDAIDIEKSAWIKAFDRRSLSNPAEKQWRVKKDGGAFDQLTGATITPRAIVSTVLKTLKYYQKHRQQVFTASQGAAHAE